MAKRPVLGKINDKFIPLSKDEIEDSPKISQEQLSGAKVYSSREEYVNDLPKGLTFMEVGVAWGYYSMLVAEVTNPDSIDLVDRYSQDSRCWSWIEFGECQCKPVKHTLEFTPQEHEQWIKNKFSKYKNVTLIRGNCEQTLLGIEKQYDYVYLDTENKRDHTEKMAYIISDLVKVGGIMGFNDYLIYDGINIDEPYGTFQTVNWFLHDNKNWSVDAIALHNLGFFDIYLRKNA